MPPALSPGTGERVMKSTTAATVSVNSAAAADADAMTVAGDIGTGVNSGISGSKLTAISPRLIASATSAGSSLLKYSPPKSRPRLRAQFSASRSC